MTTKVVPVDDMFGEMMNWAVRYSLGRRTYAVSDTVNYIVPLVPCLSDKTLWCIQTDIVSANSLGDSIDEVYWMRLLDKVEAEIKRRKEHEQ